MSKGSTQRPCDQAKFAQGWNRVFGKSRERASDSRAARGGWAPGGYVLTCVKCEKEFMGDESAWHCADCAYSEEKRYTKAGFIRHGRAFIPIPASEENPVTVTRDLEGVTVKAKGEVRRFEVGGSASSLCEDSTEPVSVRSSSKEGEA